MNEQEKRRYEVILLKFILARFIEILENFLCFLWLLRKYAVYLPTSLIK